MSVSGRTTSWSHMHIHRCVCTQWTVNSCSAQRISITQNNILNCCRNTQTCTPTNGFLKQVPISLQQLMWINTWVNPQAARWDAMYRWNDRISLQNFTTYHMVPEKRKHKTFQQHSKMVPEFHKHKTFYNISTLYNN